MKSVIRIAVLGVMVLLLRTDKIISQSLSFIPSNGLTVTGNKTTTLVFPAEVQNIDKGSDDVLVQLPGRTKNIVQLKARSEGFQQTSLTVITNDRKIYSFLVDYAENPVALNIVIGETKDNVDSIQYSSKVQFFVPADLNTVKATIAEILSRKHYHIARTDNSFIELRETGIYVKQDVFYFRLTLHNRSNTTYDVDAIKFIIKERQLPKRTAVQEEELMPVYIPDVMKRVAVDSVKDIVIALPKFSLSATKFLSIELMEKSGERNLRLPIKRKRLNHAVKLQ